MPTYAYRCEKCGVQFDQFQNFSEPPLVKCPECGENALRKLFAPVGIVFKGSGFYATDHRSPSGQASAKKNGAAETAEKPSPEAKTTERPGPESNGPG